VSAAAATVRRWLVAVRNGVRSAAGYVAFRVTGSKPPWGVRGLRGLFTAHPDLPRRISRVTTMTHPSHLDTPVHGVLGVVDARRRDAVVHALQTDGFYVFPERLDAGLVERLRSEGEALPRRASVEPGREAPLFDPAHLASSRYWCDHDDLVDEPAVQELVTDPSIAALADAYLRCDSVQCDVGLWQSVVFDEGSRDAASQLFHSDRDHLQFVKFFVYLSDVDADAGPHVFVRGSHRSRPVALRRDIRYRDDDVAAHYAARDIVELVGPRGTVIAVDTSGLHKGKPPVRGDRWIVEVEYSSSLYGPGGLPMRVHRSTDDFAARVAARPWKYARVSR